MHISDMIRVHMGYYYEFGFPFARIQKKGKVWGGGGGGGGGH